MYKHKTDSYKSVVPAEKLSESLWLKGLLEKRLRKSFSGDLDLSSLERLVGIAAYKLIM
ncbi:hypothetical protein GCM10010995_25120 [Cysteiniphilum litorale]|uniref:Uncharacterized protein n=1 Tax=Cysteiniphilum litorale TaxID=2056700 RepID=A0A8J2Z6S3_9GAMM|nr:hypothetical protein GCM10010995_25120 [Cysteiniphilum litorale]